MQEEEEEEKKKKKKRRNVDLSGMSVIEMSVQHTLGIMSTRHNLSGVGLLTTLGVGTILTGVTRVTRGDEWLDGCQVIGLISGSLYIMVSITYLEVQVRSMMASFEHCIMMHMKQLTQYYSIVIASGVKQHLSNHALHPTYHCILLGPPILQSTILDPHKNHSTPIKCTSNDHSLFWFSLHLIVERPLCEFKLSERKLPRKWKREGLMISKQVMKHSWTWVHRSWLSCWAQPRADHQGHKIHIIINVKVR